MIMIESEGITENVSTWRTDVVAKIIERLGLEKTMFEAADPKVFEWYIKNYGPQVGQFLAPPFRSPLSGACPVLWSEGVGLTNCGCGCVHAGQPFRRPLPDCAVGVFAGWSVGNQVDMGPYHVVQRVNRSMLFARQAPKHS